MGTIESAQGNEQLSSLRRFAGAHWAAILLVAFSFIVPTVNIFAHSLQTSPIDEWVYVDYLDKAFVDGYVHQNDLVGEYTIHSMSCDGVIPSATFGKCGVATAEDMPQTGHTSAAPYMPTYFWVTAGIGNVIHAISGIEPLVSWRLVGGFWLASAMLMLYLLFRRWKIPNYTTAVLGGLIIASPFVWLSNSFVSTDAPALLVGASLLYLATRIREDSASPYWLWIAFPLAISFKVTNLVAVGLTIMYLLASLVTRRMRPSQGVEQLHWPVPLWRFAGIPVIGLLFAGALEWAWLKFIALTALPVDVNIDQGVASTLTPFELVAQATNFIGSAISANPLLTPQYVPFFALLSWVSIAGVLGAVFVSTKWDRRAEMATSVAIAAVAMAPILALVLQLGTGSYFQLQSRYGGSLIPAFMLATAFVLKNRPVHWILAAYAVGMTLAGFAFSIRLP